MKVIIAQTNTTPRDFAGNTAQILDAINLAKKHNADLVVSPELSICGYLCKDLVYSNKFINDNLLYLNKIVKESEQIKETTVVVGLVTRNTSGVGKPFRNTAVVIKNGSVIATYHKHLLPFYDVFDEGRYFEPGTELTVIDIKGKKFGIAICEDFWNDKNSDDYNYRVNPVQKYRDIGIQNIISVNSSPYTVDKHTKRIEMLSGFDSPIKGTLIYVNQFGGQDDLVFDGNSLVVKNGVISHRIGFDSKNVAIDTDDNSCDLSPKRKAFGSRHIEDLWEMLATGLKDYVNKSGFKRIVLGSSGGVDSALVAALSCYAIGPKNVDCIRMPSIYSSDHSSSDAKKLHDNLGCNDLLVPIEHEELVKKYNKNMNLGEGSGNPYNKVADENIQARIRGTLVMHYSNATGALSIGTGNKSELSVGYCTLFGDMANCFNPIGDVYKLEVFALAKYYNKFIYNNIPENILIKPPSAELRPGQTDEASLLPYEILDPILRCYIENYITELDDLRDRGDTIIGNWLYSVGKDRTMFDKWISNWDNALKDYSRITNLIDRSEFKRRMASICIKVHDVAFGSGRRISIVKG